MTGTSYAKAVLEYDEEHERAIRKTVDEFGKHLRRRVASAEQSPDLKDFVRRSFWNADEGGNA